MGESRIEPAIGGYLELELPFRDSVFHKNALLYQSGRAAFRALIQSVRPNRVFVPNFIVDSMIAPLLEEGVDYRWYDLDESLEVPDSVPLQRGDLLLYVNYYGVCQGQVDHVLERFPPDQVVLDFSQAFFDAPKEEALATIYSPRKFFGIPDGGMLITSLDISSPEAEDGGSIDRMPHLLKRLYLAPEDGYSDYLQAEKGLEETIPRAMSGLTRRLLGSIEFERVKERRLTNFAYLQRALGEWNEFRANDTRLEAPLCYPFAANSPGLRGQLLRHRIFVPSYWREAEERVDSAFSQKMIDSLLPLPLDQRYGEEDMARLVSLIQEYVQ